MSDNEKNLNNYFFEKKEESRLFLVAKSEKP